MLNYNLSVVSDYFPTGTNESNFKDVIQKRYLFIGIVDHMEESVRKLKTALSDCEENYETPKVLNKTQFSMDANPKKETIDSFKKKYSLDFIVYDYVRKGFDS